MAIIKRSKVSVYGLPEDLAALTAVDVAEQAARIAGDLAEKTRAEAAELTLTNNLASEASTARAAELVLRTDLASEVARAIAEEAYLQAQIDAKEAASNAADSALGVRIDNVLNNVDGVALNSLAEIVTAFQAADGTLNGAITSLASSASTDLTTEINARTTADTALQTAIDNEATARINADAVLQTAITTETADRIAADTALDTSLKAFATEAVRTGGAVPEMETVVVSSNKIVLTNAPKNGSKGVMNFGRVSYVDVNNVENLAPVTLDLTDASGKTFIVNTDVASEWNTYSVQIQYWYVAAA